MRKIEIANSRTAVLAIQEEIRRSDESKYDHRLHGLLLVASGQSCRQAALLLGEDPRTVQRWARDGLRDGARGGRPPKLATDVLAALEADLRDRPDSLRWAAAPWRKIAHRRRSSFPETCRRTANAGTMGRCIAMA